MEGRGVFYCPTVTAFSCRTTRQQVVPPEERDAEHAGEEKLPDKLIGGRVSCTGLCGQSATEQDRIWWADGQRKFRMKKFSRMPKSESGGLGGASASGSSSGVSGYFGKVFAVGRYQVTVEELIAEGKYRGGVFLLCVLSVSLGIFRDTPVCVWGALPQQLCSFHGLRIHLL